MVWASTFPSVQFPHNGVIKFYATDPQRTRNRVFPRVFPYFILYCSPSSLVCSPSYRTRSFSRCCGVTTLYLLGKQGVATPAVTTTHSLGLPQFMSADMTFITFFKNNLVYFLPISNNFYMKKHFLL